jgi:hypothetical protein
MEILAYGEDALTYKALVNDFSKITGEPYLNQKIFYRPSFGRCGEKCFGEFDFIIFGKQKVFLGESKMTQLVMKEEQINRHCIMQNLIKDFEIELIKWSPNRVNIKMFLKTHYYSEKTLLFNNLVFFFTQLNNVYCNKFNIFYKINKLHDICKDFNSYRILKDNIQPRIIRENTLLSKKVMFRIKKQITKPNLTSKERVDMLKCISSINKEKTNKNSNIETYSIPRKNRVLLNELNKILIYFVKNNIIRFIPVENTLLLFNDTGKPSVLIKNSSAFRRKIWIKRENYGKSDFILLNPVYARL